MGVKITKPLNSNESETGWNHAGESYKCDEEIDEVSAPQSNDNATAKYERDRLMLLYSPSERSMSSEITANSARMPKVGNSPLPTINIMPTSKCQLRNPDSFWLDKCLNPQPSHTKNSLASHAPCRPNTVKSPQVIGPRKQSARLGRPPKSGDHILGTKYGFEPLQDKSWMVNPVASAYANIYEAGLTTGQAHLRRCTAAQQVRARRPDVWDSFSVDCCLSPGAFGSRVMRKARKKNYPLITNNHHQTRVLLDSKINQANNQYSFRRCPEPQQLKASSLLAVAPRGEGIYPLRYVFYIEDTPVSMKALACGGPIITMARDCHCRISCHTRCTGYGGTYARPRTISGGGLMEPALYYQGRKVRPIMIAAQNMDDLRNFLRQLDTHYPEFRASALLNDRPNATKASCVADTNPVR